MVQLTQSCSNTHTRQGSLCAYRLFLEYIKISDGDSLNFISMSSILLIFPASLELSSAHFTLIHGGFPCITRHMFVTLLHNPPPLHSYLPHLHTVPLYSWATACCIKLSPSPPPPTPPILSAAASHVPGRPEWFTGQFFLLPCPGLYISCCDGAPSIIIRLPVLPTALQNF